MIPAYVLAEKVRMLINEPNEDAVLSALSEDTRKLSDTINLLLCDAVLFVQQNKVSGVLNPAVYAPGSSSIKNNGDGTGEIILPADFVSLIQLHINGWERPCTRVLDANSPVAMAQSNKNTRAGVCKPVCVASVNSKGQPVVCYYSLPIATTPVVKSFVYEALFDADKGLNSELSNPLVQAVVYQCAGLLYNVFERRDSANAFMSLAMSLCSKVEKE